MDSLVDLSDIVMRHRRSLFAGQTRARPFGVLVACPGLSWEPQLYTTCGGGSGAGAVRRRARLGGRLSPWSIPHQKHACNQRCRNDKRIYRPARVRRFRFDEIPPLTNLARDWWIGPRPATVKVAEEAEAVEPKFASRLLVRPGLTGWAQVNLGYASTVREEVEKLAYDLYYVKNMSFDLDLVIMAKTARILLFRTGAK